jgi:hypothetical protein
LAQVGTIKIDPLSVSSYRINQANQVVTATFEWSKVCEAAQDNNSDCTKSFNTTLNIGFNKDCLDTSFNDGSIRLNLRYRYIGNAPAQSFGCDLVKPYEAFCFFNAFPGDQKVFITNGSSSSLNRLKTGDQMNSILGLSSGPDPSSLSYRAVRIFYAQSSSFSGITLKSPSKELPLNASGALSENRIDGLTNALPYAFLSASVDEAGNVVFFSDPLVPGSVMSPNPTPTGETQGAIPEEVYGLLGGRSCFIATIAFGSQDAYPVMLLRLFRDEFLLKFDLGRGFTQWYYQRSPYWAVRLGSHPHWVALIKLALVPAVIGLAVIDQTMLIFGLSFFQASVALLSPLVLILGSSFMLLARKASKKASKLRASPKQGAI